MKRLYRSRDKKMLAGILGGIAEYFNIDPTIVRLAFIVLFFMSWGSLVLVYFISIFIIPKDRGSH